MDRNRRNGHRTYLLAGSIFATSLVVISWLMIAATPAAQKVTNEPPVVSITSPAPKATFRVPFNLTITATATDSHGIARVEFFLGPQKIGEDVTAPYSVTWPDLGAGNYQLTARAVDKLGADTRVKSPITVLADPKASSGIWSPVIGWPDIGIHLHVLPNGHVLTWADDDHPDYHDLGTRAADKLKAYVVTNVDTGTSVEIDNDTTNLFCSGHAFLPDGRLLVMGGHEGANGEGSVDANIFDYRVGEFGNWSRTAAMASGRWYPSAITLDNGDVITVAGSGVGNPELPEIWSAGVWRPMPTDASRALPYYPFMHQISNGKVFVSGPNTGWDGTNPIWTSSYLDPTSGAWTPVASMQVPARDYGNAIMYEPDKIAVFGGGDPPTATVELIDLRSPTPTWTYSASMAYARRQHNATLLPDGTVVVTGGTGGAGFNNAVGTVLRAELWRPSTGTWSTLAPMGVPRLYHSTAILLPDGRILSAGGGRPWATGEPEHTEHRNAEIFSPRICSRGSGRSSPPLRNE